MLEALAEHTLPLAELRAVRLVEDEDHLLSIDGEVGTLLQEDRQLLQRRHDDLAIVSCDAVLQALRVGRPADAMLIEAAVLLERLVVEVLAVDDEEHLINEVEAGGQLGGLEARECLPRARRVPDEASSLRA